MKGMTRRELEITDRNEIIEILDKCSYLHLGLCDGDEPYVVPMNYGYTMDENGKLNFYLHGAVWGKKLDIMRKNPKIFAEMECDVEPFEGDDLPEDYTCPICKHGRDDFEPAEM